MRRIYCLFPDQLSCKAVVTELEARGIPERHLHVIASIEQKLEGLPEATIWQKTELAHGLEIGTGLGGAAGLLGGVLAVTFPPGGLVLGGGALLAGTLAGAGFGAVVSALMKSHDHNHNLHHFQSQIEQGQILLLVDIPRDQVKSISDLILTHHPEASVEVAVPKH